MHIVSAYRPVHTVLLVIPTGILILVHDLVLIDPVNGPHMLAVYF